jgi:hypothetical protein
MEYVLAKFGGVLVPLPNKLHVKNRSQKGHVRLPPESGEREPIVRYESKVDS